MKILLTIFSSVAVLVYVYLNIHNGNVTIFMKDELAMKHAYLEFECESCHKPWNGVTDKVCVKCHEEIVHFVNTDFSEMPEHPIKNVTCLNCHSEHKGRVNNIKLVSDPLCLECHPPDFMLGRKFKIIG